MKHIEVKDLYFGYTSEYVLKGINLDIGEGEIVALIGDNGSGKSTLIKLILGELNPNKGSVKVLDQDISKIKSFKKIGYVPQVQNFEKVAFPITCLEIVSLNQYEDFGFLKIPTKKHKEKAIKVLEEMGLRNYINTPFNELSGGLQQRVIISRAMINNPEILILDEPTAGIDKSSKGEFLKLIKDINEKSNITILIVTHEMEFVEGMLSPNRKYIVEDGGIKNA